MHTQPYLFLSYLIAFNLLFRDFERTFTGQIIDPNDLIIKEQIGEGELAYKKRNYVMIILAVLITVCIIITLCVTLSLYMNITPDS